ncbi:hypothetical protein [Paenibacillus odorifer]|nr:hypothetical protein [Paenibacillus odorifer]
MKADVKPEAYVWFMTNYWETHFKETVDCGRNKKPPAMWVE